MKKYSIIFCIFASFFMAMSNNKNPNNKPKNNKTSKTSEKIIHNNKDFHIHKKNNGLNQKNKGNSPSSENDDGESKHITQKELYKKIQEKNKKDIVSKNSQEQ